MDRRRLEDSIARGINLGRARRKTAFTDNMANTINSTTTHHNDPARWRWLCLLAMLVSVVVYAGSWTGGLVWDDHYLVDGSAIGGGKSLWNCITVPFLSHYFRPLVSIDFFFERRLWHDNALGYRLVSTALHAATTGLMIGLLRDSFGSRRAALFGAVIFAVHPVQVGAVAWIGGRTDTLCELWLLLFARCLVISAQSVSRRGPMLAWAVIWYLLALFTKEQSLALLPLVPLAFHCWKPSDGENTRRSEWVLTVPFALMTLLFLVLGWYLGMPRPQSLVGTAMEQLAQAGRILGYYALVLLTPTPTLMHLLSLGPFERAGALSVLFGYAALAGAVALLVRLWQRDRPSAWFLALTLLSLLPVSGFLPLPFLLVAPYRAAIASIGVAALLGSALARLTTRERKPSAARTGWAWAGGTLITAYAALTIWGAMQWRDEVNLFQRIIRSDPEAVVPPYVIAYMYNGRSDTLDAARMVEATLQNIFRSDAWKDRDSAMKALREDPKVLQRARQNQGMTSDPHLWLASIYNDLGRLYVHLGQNGAALLTYQIGEAIDPKNPDIISGIGYCQAQFGHDSEAVALMRKALAINPDHAYSHEWLGRYYTRTGDWDQAEKELAAWLKAAPDNSEAQTMLQDARTQIERRRALQSGNLFRH